MKTEYIAGGILALAAGYYLLRGGGGLSGSGGGLGSDPGGNMVSSTPGGGAKSPSIGLDAPAVVQKKKIDDGMIPTAIAAFGGSSPQSAEELQTLTKKGFSTSGLSGSYDPGSATYYSFAPQTTAVEKSLISRAGFSTAGLSGSYDPSTGKITTFSGQGTVNYAAPMDTSKKSASIPQDFSSQGGGNYSGIQPPQPSKKGTPSPPRSGFGKW